LTKEQIAMTRFEAWESHNLAKFAQDATARLTEQDELIKSLEADLKAAIRAYRHLIIEGAKNESLPISTEQRF
jgi:hypothetical protein